MQLERHLGLNFWDEEFSGGVRFRSEACDSQGKTVLDISSNLQQDWQGIDQRLKFPTWMQEFVKRGGELVIQATTPEDLEEYVQTYDLVVVAAGKYLRKINYIFFSKISNDLFNIIN